VLEGELFRTHKEYVRRQMIYCLLQVRASGSWGRSRLCIRLMLSKEEDNPTLHLVAALLLYDGRSSGDDVVFGMMHTEGSFPRLVELVQMESVQEDTSLHQLLLELLYESSRVQRLVWEDFGMFQRLVQHSVEESELTYTSRCDR
jgi:hypothetical protein